MSDQIEACPQYSTTRKLTGFARNHPVLTIFGVGGAALVGGAELAAGVVLGAGIDALLRRQRPNGRMQAEAEVEPQAEAQAVAQPEPGPEPEIEAQAEPSEAHPFREKSRAAVARAPHVLRERARAVFDAMRGRTTPGSERFEQQPSETGSEAPPVEQRRTGESPIIQSAD